MWSIAIAFKDMENLTLANITFTNCSYNNTHTDGHFYVSALQFYDGFNLNLTEITIINAGFSIVDTVGAIELQRINVSSKLYHAKKRKYNYRLSYGGSMLWYHSCLHAAIVTISRSHFIFTNEVKIDPKENFYKLSYS